jgi:hypothetical protein
MKPDLRTVLGLTMLAGLLAVVPARAEDAPPTCEVPAYLLSSESSLPKVAQAVKTGGKLDILVVGSRSSTINAPDGTAYPGRLEATLREKLPTVKVNVNVELQIKKTGRCYAIHRPRRFSRRGQRRRCCTAKRRNRRSLNESAI